MSKPFLKKKSTVAAFGVAALVSGMIFLDRTRISGNVVIEKTANLTPKTPISLIGAMLILGAIVTFAYVATSKE